MTLTAEIISIGDELTSGQRLDTNSQWLSQKLGDLGIKTIFHTTVGDSLVDNVDAFRHAARRARLIIATGGLGPTADDLTREAIATAFDRPLELRAEAMAHIESLFALRKRPMPERNRAQAMFPESSRIIDNPHGTAPGIDLSVTNSIDGPVPSCRIFSLPGVPAEMMEMYSLSVEPRLTAELGAGSRRWFYHCLKVFGIGESDVEKQLPDLIRRDRDPIVGITVSKATITLRIAALSSSEAEFRNKIDTTVAEIQQSLGLLVFGTGDIDLHDVVAQTLDEQGRTLGIIEVGAGEWIQHSLSHLASRSSSGLQIARWYPSLNALERDWPVPDGATDPIAAVDSTTLSPNPSQSTPLLAILESAAQGLLRSNDLDICLAVGIYPSVQTVQSASSLPFADFSMVLARRNKPSKRTQVSLGGHPDVIYHRLAKAGLNFLRLELISDPGDKACR